MSTTGTVSCGVDYLVAYMITVIYNLCRRYLATQVFRSLKSPVFVNLLPLINVLNIFFVRLK